ncbi:tubulin delta chain-like [Chiloscyllium plagiosum]|uniref:tubulin delta chain-like n=1 Tax=Chiloscyllium plagiosum TaxID=36176 RepID=UPI001CB7B242|nr:tubulin delta chain-like [Chiloscyllium plagiosum]
MQKNVQVEDFSWPVEYQNLLHLDAADGFKEQALYTSWMPADSALSVWRTSTTFNKYEKSASIVSNSQCLQKSLDRIVTKAWDMFASRAYVHQYMKHGISEEDFVDCFTTVEQVIASYSSLG